MITVHHLDNSRSQRILWLLEELGVPYEIVKYQREASMKAPEALRAVHPLGKSPVITDGALTMAESGAIIEYLLETYHGEALIPAAGTPARQRYRYWLHYAEGSAMPQQFLHFIFNALPKRSPALVRPLVRRIVEAMMVGYIRPQLKLHADYWEAALAELPWFAGAAFSAADVAMSFPLEIAAGRPGFLTQYPLAKMWLERIHQRPAYQRALQRGGLYAYAA